MSTMETNDAVGATAVEAALMLQQQQQEDPTAAAVPPAVAEERSSSSAPPPQASPPPPRGATSRPLDPVRRRRDAAARVSRAYGWLSLVGAVLAICTTTAPPSPPQPMDHHHALPLHHDESSMPTAYHRRRSRRRLSSPHKASVLSAAFLSSSSSFAARKVSVSARSPAVSRSSRNQVVEKEEEEKEGDEELRQQPADAELWGLAPEQLRRPPQQPQLPLWLRRAILLPDQDAALPTAQRKRQPQDSIAGECAAAEKKGWWQRLQRRVKRDDDDDADAPTTSEADAVHISQQEAPEAENKQQQNQPQSASFFSLAFWKQVLVSAFGFLMDPTLLHPSEHTLTDLIDKILTSTPRLLAISNFLMALTYLLHTAVADWFLGNPHNDNNNNNNWHNQHAIMEHGREKMGGFLVFKFLLISAVLAPDTLDLLILLTWYTLLAFLRSLRLLCATAVTTAAAAGQAPSRGVLELLLTVWMANGVAATMCWALFHEAGWSMVLLLTSDCALTAVDVLAHILQYFAAVKEMEHAAQLVRLEQQQQQQQQQAAASAVPGDGWAFVGEAEEEEDHEIEPVTVPVSGVVEGTAEEESLVGASQDRAGGSDEEESLERLIQLLEEEHNRRTAWIETAVFGLQLLCNMINVVHYLHIWSLHGVQFTLIDGVLALHLHSAVSSASQRICQRRHVASIARNLDSVFDNATEGELKRAAAAGDVCCVCLSPLTMHVKKVACGHLYHAHCLREVVERARSMPAAKCPLCRASVLDGQYTGSAAAGPTTTSTTDNNNSNTTNRGLMPPEAEQPGGDGGLAEPQPEDQSLFRLSTENLIPSWMPIPNFSFEVVRRAPPLIVESEETTTAAAEQQQQQQQQAASLPPPQQQPSLLRRLLVLAGALPLSPEEETAALEQLVDMFPQYDRADLLRELRERSSAEAVAERILQGTFTGSPR